MKCDHSLNECVRKVVQQSINWSDFAGFNLGGVDDLMGGKMLRTRLAGHLGEQGADWEGSGTAYACAAIELIHTASLFHDDVIDGATLRRGRPTLWRRLSPNCSILIGDLLFCEALKVVSQFCPERMADFVAKVREVCAAEAQQELVLRGGKADVERSLHIARGKTGPLFAFAAASCGGEDRPLCAALEEAGYRVGAAYQLADDLLDEIGDEFVTGKTLGTDRLRSKFTLAHIGDSAAAIATHIESLCTSALRILRPWPQRREGLKAFLDSEFRRAVELPADAHDADGRQFHVLSAG